MDNSNQRPAENACQAGAAVLFPYEEALHIQAAAVAAQQGALTHEEMRLERRCQELAQQEQQLGEHLEEKQSRLVQLRDDARQAHTLLRSERTAYEKRVAQVLQKLATDRRNLADQERQLQAGREHLRQLHGRLRKRWRRTWKAERAGFARQELEIESRGQRTQEERDRLNRDQQKLAQEQARFSAETAVGRRYLRSERERLRRLQTELDQREAKLTRKETAAAEEAQRLALEKRHWENEHGDRVREAAELETRIANYRAKLVELEQQVEQRKGLDALGERGGITRESSPIAPLPLQNPVAESDSPPDAGQNDQLTGRLADLERLAGEVADQRRCLVEECLRFLLCRDQWQKEGQATAADLDRLGQRLLGVEQALAQREQAVQEAEKLVQQKFEDLAEAQKRLEGEKALLVARASAWEGDHQRQIAELQSRELLVQERLDSLSRLGQLWQGRRRRQVLALRAQRSACEELRREYALLHEQWSTRMNTIAQQQRGLAQRSLALDQYELEQVERALDAAAMDKRLKELRRRTTALSASEQRHLARERTHLEAETASLERRLQQLYEQEQRTTDLEAELAGKLVVWEREQEANRLEQARRDHEFEILSQERHLQDGQLAVLRGEIERLAQSVIGEKDMAPVRLGQAA
jgi:hypothetical protein